MARSRRTHAERLARQVARGATPPSPVSPKADWLRGVFGPGSPLGKGSTARSVGSGLLLGLLIDAIVRGGIGVAGGAAQAGQEGRALEAQGNLAGPLGREQALLPITQAQRQAALYMLMQQLGGQGAPMLAEGETLT